MESLVTSVPLGVGDRRLRRYGISNNLPKVFSSTIGLNAFGGIWSVGINRYQYVYVSNLSIYSYLDNVRSSSVSRGFQVHCVHEPPRRYASSWYSSLSSPIRDFPGPKTVFFWAPMMKWCLVAAGLKDLSRPADKLSMSQNLGSLAALLTLFNIDLTPMNQL